ADDASAPATNDAPATATDDASAPATDDAPATATDDASAPATNDAPATATDDEPATATDDAPAAAPDESASRTTDLDVLLDLIDARLEDGRLLAPDGDGATAYFEQALALSSFDPRLLT